MEIQPFHPNQQCCSLVMLEMCTYGVSAMARMRMRVGMYGAGGIRGLNSPGLWAGSANVHHQVLANDLGTDLGFTHCF